MVAISAIIGFVLGLASWMVAAKLTAGARVGARVERALPLLAGLCGSGVLAGATARSGGDGATVAIVAILAIPLLITLLTDILARLVFPAVLLPGLLAALAIAATGLQALLLLPALMSGSGAAAVTAILVALCRWLWSGVEEPPLGSGDVLIAAAIGATLGPDETPLVLFAGMLLGTAAAGLLLLTRRGRRDDLLPYGAFLCGSALVALAL